MSEYKIVIRKIIISIICAVLLCGIIFMSVMISIFFTPREDSNDTFFVTYEYLPNVCGDDCVYVSENFFVENDMQIPDRIEFKKIDGVINADSVNGAFYYGRSKDVGYSFVTGGKNNNILGGGWLSISCEPKDIKKIDSNQTHGEYAYEVKSKEHSDSNGVSSTSRTYTVNVVRGQNTSKKCQLTVDIVIKHDEDTRAEDNIEFCDNLFYSLLDNLVYRNI